MRIARDPAAPGPLVTGFSARGFMVGESEHRGGLKLTPEAASDWAAKSVHDLSESDFADLLSLEPRPEFLIFGTGPDLVRPAPALVASLEERGIGVEIMDSRAAARAWGVLRGEGRWIAAALLPLR